jgi:hypothetical protein
MNSDILKSKGSNLNMGYGNRDKPERKSARAGFVDARLDELRRRWENATDEREKSEVSEQIREWQSLSQNDPHPPAIGDKDFSGFFATWPTRASQ